MKLRWVGEPLFQLSGYSNNVRSLIKAMADLGHDAKGITDETPWPGFENIVTTQADIDKDTHVVGRTYVYNQFLLPFKKVAKSLTGILVLEGDRLPETWVATANLMDMVYTASNYGKQQFINNGIIPEKIRVLPHGIDPKVFYPMPHIQKSDKFTFLFNGGFAIPGDRKGADILAKAFSEEFNENEQVKCIIKINPAYTGGSSEPANYLRKIGNNHKKLIILDGGMTQEELCTLYNYSDIHVLPTKGEAFSMNLAESMACQRPVIATNWSGHLDFCKPEFSYLIDIDRFELAHYGAWDIQCGTKWAKISIPHLQQLMRYAVDNPQEVQHKGRLAQRYILDHYTWRMAAEQMYDYLKVFD